MKHIVTILIVSIGLSACVSCSSPPIDREELLKLPVHTTPIHGISYSIGDGVDGTPEFWGMYLDSQADQWTECMMNVLNRNSVLNSNLFLSWRTILVDGSFRCNFENANCTGEIIGFDLAIYISVFNEILEDGHGLCSSLTPSLCHEWAHTCAGSNERGICLRGDHSNIGDLEPCL